MRTLAPLPIFALIFLALTACSSPTDPAQSKQQSSQSQEPTPSLAPRAIELTLQTPTPAWSIAPQAAYQVAEEIWCIHKLTPPKGMVAQMISEVSGRIVLNLDADQAALPVRHFVHGKTWKWNSNPEVTFIDSTEQIADPLAAARPIEISSAKPAP